MSWVGTALLDGNITLDGGEMAHISNVSAASRNLLRKSLAKVVAIFPAASLHWMYTVLLSPRPLRSLTNRMLRGAIPDSLTLPEGVLLLNRNDPIVSGALALGVYEPGSLAVFRSLITRDDMNILDLGANIGTYTLIAASRAPKGRILAFEPDVENSRILSETLRRNGLANVTLVKAGAAEVESMGSLFLDPHNKGKHSLVAGNGNLPTASIRLRRVDDVLGELRVTSLHLIKMDIEGWEAKALRGMRETLRVHHPTLLFEFSPSRIRLAGDDPLRMLEELRGFGYALSLVSESDGKEVPIQDLSAFIGKFARPDEYANLLAR